MSEQKNNAKMSEAESTADDSKKLSEDGRGLGAGVRKGRRSARLEDFHGRHKGRTGELPGKSAGEVGRLLRKRQAQTTRTHQEQVQVRKPYYTHMSCTKRDRRTLPL
jgi:hypothetical protein